MLSKQLLQARALIVFALVATGCGAPITAETTTVSVEQPVETTYAETWASKIEGEAGLVQDNPESTVVSITMITLPTLEYSQAWIEYHEVKTYVGDSSFESRKIVNDYLSSNPNDISTPMGALCWAFHELSRSYVMGILRWTIDDYLIPAHMEQYSVSSEQIGSPGPEATEAFLDLVSGKTGSVGSVDDGTDGQTALPAENGDLGPVGSTGETDGLSEEEYWESFRIDHEFAGDGTAWSNAIQAVASLEMAAAFRAGESLPPDVQVYADALVAYAKERVGKEFDPSTKIDDTEFDHRGFPGLGSFMAAAKYHQDCKRAGIADIPGTVDSPSISTTTVPPTASTTTTAQPAVEDRD